MASAQQTDKTTSSQEVDEVQAEQLTTEHLKVPESKEKNRSSRPTSPVQGLTNAQEFSLATQISRANLIKNMSEQSLSFQPGSVEEVDSKLKMLNKLWEAFDKDHESLGAACRSAFFHHPYLMLSYYEKAFMNYEEAQSILVRLKAQLKGDLPQQTRQSTTQHSGRQRAALPEIKLPQFSGTYSEWPTYRDLFKSLIIQNEQLSKVEKLQYLKTSITGAAAQLIANIKISEDQFEPAWQKIVDRFDDKDRLILSYVENLCSPNSPIQTTAQDLYSVVSSTRDNLEALKALDVPVEHWNYMLLYIITRRLDSTLRETWELQCNYHKVPKTYTNLLEFLQARAHSLEAADHSHDSSSRTIHRKPLVAHRSSKSSFQVSTTHPSTTHTRTAQYPCDYCGEDHYIVTCPKFRDLTPELRHKAVVAQKLCFNCFGHHNLHACGSSHSCKTCGLKHHTMIHLPSSKIAQQASTSQSHSKSQTESKK